MSALATLAVAVGAALTAPSASGTSPGREASIEELARSYRTGAAERAAAVVARWSDERVAHEVERFLDEAASRREDAAQVVLPSLDVAGLDARSRGDVDERESERLAVVGLLAEGAATRVDEGDVRPLAPCLASARRVLESRPPDPRGRDFARAFYLLSGLLLDWHVELAESHRLLVTALQAFPNDAELHTALGSTIETVASLRTYTPPPGSPGAAARSSGGYRSERGGIGGTLGATLAQAEDHLGKALALDPSLHEARLRLAHVRLLEGRIEEALPDLERVAEETRQRRQRYLALLFLGNARQRRGDLAGAVAAYRACVADGPRAQTALLALGRALVRLGDEPAAQDAFAAATARDAPFDPWWSYAAGQPDRVDGLLNHLRALVE